MSRKRIASAGAALAAALLTVVAFRHVDVAPLVWSAAAWAAVAVVGWVCAEPTRRRISWLNVAAICLAVAFGEAFLWVRAPSPEVFGPEFGFEGSYFEPNSFFVKPDTTLGYRPRPGASARAIKRYRGQVVYDVEYDIGGDGLRASPPSNANPDGCVLFFGDSFAWGEGVGNTETSAYQLGLMLKGTRRIYNFGVTGYSAHQFAAAAEQGLIQKLIRCDPNQPVHLIYEVLPNNVGRAAGLGAWDVYGPRYAMSKSGEIARRGYFSRGDYILDDRVLVPNKTLRYLNKTMMYQRAFGRSREPNDFDLRRFIKIVERARSVLARQIPQATLLVILWYDMDEDGGLGKRTRAMHDALEAAAFEVRYVGEVVPGYDADPLKYHIPRDGHPTSEAHRLVAAYLREQIQKGSSAMRPVGLE